MNTAIEQQTRQRMLADDSEVRYKAFTLIPNNYSLTNAQANVPLIVKAAVK